MDATPRTMSGLLAQVVTMAAWLGAGAIVAAAVAPAAFAVLPTRALAGALVGRVLPVVFWTGLAAGLAGLALELAGAGGRWSRARIAGAALVVLSCAAAQLVVAPRIARVREAIGPSLESLALDDARRIAFGRLHAASVGWLALAMLGAGISLGFALAALRPRG